MNSLSLLFLRLILSRSKRNHNQVYFYNIWGQYNDNTKALAELLHKKHPELTIYYEVADEKTANTLPKFIYPAIRNTMESEKIKYSSKIIIDNYWGTVHWSGSGFLANVKYFLIKQTIANDILYISTGHGTPMKRLESDIVGNNYDKYISSTDVMFVLDDHLKRVIDRVTLHSIPKFFISGSPRNDILFAEKGQIESIKEKVGIGNKRLILFAPTFRTVKIDNETKFIGPEDFFNSLISNETRICSALSRKFGGEWIIGVRVHPGIKMASIIDFSNSTILNANLNNDMADYLAISDILVTDYSSCAFDFLITMKPCFLLWLDEKNYKNKERGLYFSDDELPFYISRSIEELIVGIESFDELQFFNKTEKFCKLIGMSRNNNASQRVLDYIERYLEAGEHQ